MLQTLYNLSRLSRSRQEEAAQNGLLPLLQQVIKINSPLKEFALPLLCDMANAGKSARRQLWKIDGVQRESRVMPTREESPILYWLLVYLDLLMDTYWRVSLSCTTGFQRY